MRPRSWSVLGALTAALLLVAGPAAAHVMLLPGEVAPGGELDTDVYVVHGCGPDGAIPANDDEVVPTTALTLEVPEPLVVEPDPVEGWTVTNRDAADGGAEVRWENEDDAGTTESLTFGVTVDAGDVTGEREIWLEAVQECVDGERMYWTLPEMAERDGELPGVRLAVSSDAAGADEGPPVLWIIVGAVGVAGLAAGVSVWLTNRRIDASAEPGGGPGDDGGG